MKKDKKYIINIVFRIIFTLLLIFTCITIFDFSKQNGTSSGNLSRKVMENIARIFTNNDEQIATIVLKGEPILRKIAHFYIYTSLGIWAMCMMQTYFKKETKNYDTVMKKRMFISILIGFIYASTDEIHQIFIPNRSAEVRDVFLDTLGVANGVLLIAICVYIFKYYKNITKELK